MNTESARRGVRRTASLAVLCLVISGCAHGMPNRPIETPDRFADASKICRETMGIDPGNAPHDLCVQSLLQNPPTSNLPSPATPPVDGSGAQKSCARFGLVPGSEDWRTCAGNLDASLFEAIDVAAR